MVSNVDIGGYSLKYTKNGNFHEYILGNDVIGGTFTIPQINETELAGYIEKLRKEGITKINLLLPDQWARQIFVRVSDLPAEYTKEYILWRARDQIREEVYSGCKIDAHICKTEKDIETGKLYADCYVCLVKEELINKLTELFENAKIKIMSIDMSCHAIYNFISQNGILKENFGLLNIGHEVTTFYFFVDSEPVYVRIIETAGRHFTDEIIETLELKHPISKSESAKKISEHKIFPDKIDFNSLSEFESHKLKATDKFLKELHITYEFFISKYPHIKLSEIIISGGFGKIPNIKLFLENFLAVNIKLLENTEKIQYSSLLFDGTN